MKNLKNNLSSVQIFSVMSLLRQLLPHVLIAILIILGIVGYIVWNNGDIEVLQENSENDVTIPLSQVDVASKEVGQNLASLYSSESAPYFDTESNSSNFGLEGGLGTDAELQGTFVFSGKKVNTSNSYTHIFTLDLETEGVDPVMYMPEYFTSAMAEFKNPSNPEDFFLLATSEEAYEFEDDGVGIHQFDSETGSIKSLTSTKGRLERALEWSESSGLLALNRVKIQESTNVDLLPIDNWETVIVNPESDSVVAVIGGSLYPKWSPDGSKLIFLKKDGLYLYNRQTKEKRQVVPVADSGEVIATSMIDVSPDGTHLVWTTAKSGIITVAEVVSWEAFELNILGRIQIDGTEFYWPQFSPDGKYYAVQAIDVAGENDFFRKNARIEIRPVDSRSVVFEYSLEEFIFDALFTDDWIAKEPIES